MKAAIPHQWTSGPQQRTSREREERERREREQRERAEREREELEREGERERITVEPTPQSFEIDGGPYNICQDDLLSCKCKTYALQRTCPESLQANGCKSTFLKAYGERCQTTTTVDDSAATVVLDCLRNFRNCRCESTRRQACGGNYGCEEKVSDDYRRFGCYEGSSVDKAAPVSAILAGAGIALTFLAV